MLLLSNTKRTISRSLMTMQIDLQLFLGRRLVVGSDEVTNPNYAEDVVVGSLVRDRLEANCEWVSKLIEEDSDLQSLRSVAVKGEKLYMRTRNAASGESVKRAKTVTSSKTWSQTHSLFGSDINQMETRRTDMLARVSGFRPTETVFEIDKRSQDQAVDVIRRQRSKIDGLRESLPGKEDKTPDSDYGIRDGISEELQDSGVDVEMDSASDNELKVTFEHPEKDDRRKSRKEKFQSSEFFMSYNPSGSNPAEDRAYGVHSGANTNLENKNFFSAAKDATMDLGTDEGGGIAEPSRQKRWDKKAKKYITPADKDTTKGGRPGDPVGKRFIRSESGQKIAASFRSGRFEAWKKANRVAKMPRVGDSESALPKHIGNGNAGRRFKYQSQKAPKQADKYRDDYHKKMRKMGKAKEEQRGQLDGGQKELRGIDAVRKVRREKEKRRAKTGAGKKGKGKGR